MAKNINVVPLGVDAKTFQGTRLYPLVSSLVNTTDTLQRIPFLDGLSVKDISLVIGQNKIAHKLGRNFQGYLITKSSGPYVAYYDDDVNTDKTHFLVLQADVAFDIDIWIF